MSRGDAETILLRENIESQLKRLLTQLEDIEQLKDELDDAEYEQMREETIDQLKEFERNLQKSNAGNISLVDSVAAVQLAIHAAIRSNAPTNTFKQKESLSLRGRLASLESDRRLGKISQESYQAQAMEMILLLEKSTVTLNASEQDMLRQHRAKVGEFSVAEAVDVDSSYVIEAATKDLVRVSKK